jgi:hypothetical protein
MSRFCVDCLPCATSACSTASCRKPRLRLAAFQSLLITKGITTRAEIDATMEGLDAEHEVLAALDTDLQALKDEISRLGGEGRTDSPLSRQHEAPRLVTPLFAEQRKRRKEQSARKLGAQTGQRHRHTKREKLMADIVTRAWRSGPQRGRQEGGR